MTSGALLFDGDESPTINCNQPSLLTVMNEDDLGEAV